MTDEGTTSSESYDPVTLTATRTVDGVVVATRPLTADEVAWVQRVAAQQAAVAAADRARADLVAGLAAIAAAQAAASADLAVADAVITAVTADRTAALSLKAQADALAAKATPVLADIKTLAAGLSLLAQYRADADAALVALTQWRQAADRNAVLTDQALTFLGQLAQVELKPT